MDVRLRPEAPGTAGAQTNSRHAGPREKTNTRVLTRVALVGLGVWVAGCSQNRDNGFSRIPTPQPPAFVAGPLAVLLTNTSGFSAQVTAVGESMSEGDVPLRGQLVGSGPHLFFAPERNKGAEK